MSQDLGDINFPMLLIRTQSPRLSAFLEQIQFRRCRTRVQVLGHVPHICGSNSADTLICLPSPPACELLEGSLTL